MPHCFTKDPKGAVAPYDANLIRDIFLACDLDDDKVLTKEEIKLAFNRLGSRNPAFRTWRAVQEADFNKDGSISMEELEELVAYAGKCGYVIK
ncbi:hypothetical protein PTKIN_Ptkin01aG0074300 [Pterospermum kingtungense]